MSEQPCENFQEHDGLYNRHECPDCLGTRMFCDNCKRDHHKGGWCACKEKKIVSLEAEVNKLESENGRLLRYLGNIKKHMEITVPNGHKLSSVWVMANAALSHAPEKEGV